MECTNKPMPTELGRALTLKHSPFILAKHREHAHASSGSHQEKQADLKSILSSPSHSVWKCNLSDCRCHTLYITYACLMNGLQDHTQIWLLLFSIGIKYHVNLVEDVKPFRCTKKPGGLAWTTGLNQDVWCMHRLQLCWWFDNARAHQMFQHARLGNSSSLPFVATGWEINVK